MAGELEPNRESTDPGANRPSGLYPLNKMLMLKRPTTMKVI